MARRYRRRIATATMTSPETHEPIVMDTEHVIYKQRFASLDALLVTAEQTTSLADPVSRRPGNEYFYSSSSFEEACNLARFGWKEGADKIRAITAKIASATPTSEQFQSYHDTSGSYVDVDRFISGEPECMIEFRADARPKPIVRIGFETVVSAGEQVDSIMRRGAAIGALIDALESHNIRCEVTAVARDCKCYAMGDETAGYVLFETIIKAAEAPLDLDRLAFAVAHPSMLRRITFAVLETLPANIRKHIGVPGPYGSVIESDAPGYDVFVRSKTLATWTPATALALVNATLDKFSNERTA